MLKIAEIIIIGGGIIGTSIAYYLAQKRAKDVILLEKGILGEGSTSKCAGGIRLQFSTQINIAFSLASMEIWDHFSEITEGDISFKKVGYLFLATTEEEWATFQANVKIQRQWGIPVELLSPAEIAYRWPFLKVDDLAGGTYCPSEGYAGPYEALTAFARGARNGGVKIYEGTEVLAIKPEKDKLYTLKTNKGDFRSPFVVMATGPYAEKTGELVGLKIPVLPYRRQIFFTAPFPWLPESFPLTIDFHQGWYFRREGKGLLLSGPKDDFPSFNMHIDYEAMAITAENSMRRVPVLEKAQIVRGWSGLYEISPDHHAILGEVPSLPNFFLANGFSGHGFQHSPAVGKVMAELLLREKPSLDISSLSLERFAKGELIKEPLTAFKE